MSCSFNRAAYSPWSVVPIDFVRVSNSNLIWTRVCSSDFPELQSLKCLSVREPFLVVNYCDLEKSVCLCHQQEMLSCSCILNEWIRRESDSNFKIALLFDGSSVPFHEMILSGREPFSPAVHIIPLLNKSLVVKERGIVCIKVVPVLWNWKRQDVSWNQAFEAI